MAKTLLDAVNQVLKRANIIAGDAAPFTTLTDQAQQHNIDVAIQVINEGITELYTATHLEMPGEGAESTVTLATGTREYSLASDLVQIRWPMIDRTNTQYLFEWPGEYDDFLLFDPQQIYTGLPIWAMISPITSKLRLDRAPDSTSNGKVYTYEYDKNLTLTNATDSVPFNDVVFWQMVPAWAEMWRRDMRNAFDEGWYRAKLGTAGRILSGDQQRSNYSPRVR